MTEKQTTVAPCRLEQIVTPVLYYSDGLITIYHGDARGAYGLGGFDLLLTDPPYGIGEARNRNKTRSCLAVSKDYGNAAWDDETPSRWFLDMLRASAKWQVLWGGNYFGFEAAKGWLVWDKDNGENDFADCELAWSNLPIAVRKFKWKWQGMLQENMKNKEDREHPTQKPLQLMKWCIGLAPAAETIYDPFGGSGTTARAAKDLGKRCVMIEREEKYCEIAAKRMAQEVLCL